MLADRRLRWVLAAGVAIVFVIVVYQPGLNGPFVFDDLVNITKSDAPQIDELTGRQLLDSAHGPFAHSRPLVLQRPMARLSFALNYYFSGQEFNNFNFKITNLVIHIVNGFLVLWLTCGLWLAWIRNRPELELLAPSAASWQWLPCIVAFLWTIHPIQLTSVLYVVQRMTSMSATGVLAGLAIFVLGRHWCDRGRVGGLWIMAAAVVFGTSLGFVSKENALLLLLFAGLIELAFFRRDRLAHIIRRRLYLVYAVLFATFVLTAIVVLIRSDFILALYEIRDFTLVERVLTQSRVLFMYLGLIFGPRLSEFGLYHDDIALSTGLFTPFTTSFSLMGCVGLIAFGFYALYRRWLIGFCIIWFFVGHAVESSLLGLELAHEHRNYLPSLGPVIAAVYYAYRLYLVVNIKKAVVLGFAGILVLFSFITYQRATHWASIETLAAFQAAWHPDSVRSQIEYALVLHLKSGDITDVYKTYQHAAKLSRKNIVSVVRMQRIVSGLMAQLDEGSLLPIAPIDEHKNMDLLEAPLVINMNYLKKLDKLIELEISHRLTHYAIDSESIIGMMELRTCLASKFATCPPSKRVEHWFQLVLERDSLLNGQRKVVLILLAQLRTYIGDTETALSLLRSALPLTKSETPIWLEMLSVYRSVKDYESIKHLIATVERDVVSSGHLVSKFLTAKDILLKEAASYELSTKN